MSPCNRVWKTATGVVERRYAACACKTRRKVEDTDLGVDEEAIAKYQFNQALRQHGEAIIMKDDGA